MQLFKKFSFRVTLRVILLLTNVLLIAYIFGDNRLFFNQIILSLLLVIQVIELVRYINKTNRELAKFILAIRHSDFSINFNKTKLGGSFDELSNAFNEIISLYKKAKIEKEAQYQYLRTVVSHINIGIISVENDEDITLMNRTAENLLNVKGIGNWKIMAEKQKVFVKYVEEMGQEGRRLIELSNGNEAITLSLDVSTVMLLDQEYKLITFQDIRSEIEQKEIEAWHKLIRILTHEIMNSATPISSLTETMQMMLDQETISDETINDLRFSLKTIQKRSDGMLAFIDDYRKITRVPTPKKIDVYTAELIKEIEVLVKPNLNKKGIDLNVSTDSNQVVSLDPKLIEQILINLIKNAEDALINVDSATISLKSFTKGNSNFIEVSDNGIGIPNKELKEIFVPFYTTKKHGSGIGLSLSKQIMQLHNGSIKVSSSVNKGTSFTLSFKSDVKTQ